MWRLIRWQLAAFSAGAAALHFAEVELHLDEWWLFGAFFFAVAWFQVGWAVLVVVRGERFLLTTGLAVNAAVVLIWVWSRTTGLPMGPEAGEPEAIGAADLFATILELVILLGATVLLSRIRPSREPSRAAVIATAISAWVLVVAATALAFFLAPEESAVPH
jgi:hypothetical protein